MRRVHWVSPQRAQQALTSVQSIGAPGTEQEGAEDQRLSAVTHRWKVLSSLVGLIDYVAREGKIRLERKQHVLLVVDHRKCWGSVRHTFLQCKPRASHHMNM